MIYSHKASPATSFGHYKIVFTDGTIDHFMVDPGAAGGRGMAIAALHQASVKHPLKQVRSLELVRSVKQEPHQPAH